MATNGVATVARAVFTTEQTVEATAFITDQIAAKKPDYSYSYSYFYWIS
jgi:hypothetical protein